MSHVGDATLLLDGRPSLSGWYAEPMTPAAAHQLLEAAEAQWRRAVLNNESSLLPRLCAGAARFWLEPVASGEAWEGLAALAETEAERAFLALLQGQLLASRKQSGALELLQRGFMLASDLLDADGYFELLRRHERLGCLHYGDGSAVPVGLGQLLSEAAVIEQLGGCPGHPPKREPIDTIG